MKQNRDHIVHCQMIVKINNFITVRKSWESVYSLCKAMTSWEQPLRGDETAAALELTLFVERRLPGPRARTCVATADNPGRSKSTCRWARASPAAKHALPLMQIFLWHAFRCNFKPGPWHRSYYYGFLSVLHKSSKQEMKNVGFY